MDVMVTFLVYDDLFNAFILGPMSATFTMVVESFMLKVYT